MREGPKHLGPPPYPRLDLLGGEVQPLVGHQAAKGDCTAPAVNLDDRPGVLLRGEADGDLHGLLRRERRSNGGRVAASPQLILAPTPPLAARAPGARSFATVPGRRGL